MRFRIDENLERVAAVMPHPKPLETVATELCKRFVDADMIDDRNITETLLNATGPFYIADTLKILTEYLGVERIKSDVWLAFLSLKIWGDADCPFCGGQLAYVETEGHETPSHDYMLPPDWTRDYDVYECRYCGETIKIKCND